MAKINQWSLTELVDYSRQFKSAGDFVARHSNPISGQNGFLVLHGNVDDVVKNYEDKPAIEIPATRISTPNFSTAPGDDPDEADTKYVASVFSPSSIVYEILWYMCLNPVVDLSVKISVGRTNKNDIFLENQHVSKHHGDFILAKEKNNFSVFYKDDYSHNGTSLRRADETEEHRIPSDRNILIPSRSEIGIGPFAFTFYSAADVYNRVLRILNRDK